MKAVVLAAGLGTRMRPLTFTKPKFLLPVAGKPALDHVLLLLKNAGINEIAMIVGYGREHLIKRYGDGSEFGIKLRYIHQQKLLGTANAISLAEDFVGNENFLAINGDTLIDQESLNLFLRRYGEVAPTPNFGA